MEAIQRLEPCVQNYAWGVMGSNSSLVSRMAGGTPDASKPYAELWMGTHPSAPSKVAGQGLSEFLKKNESFAGVTSQQEWSWQVRKKESRPPPLPLGSFHAFSPARSQRPGDDDIQTLKSQTLPYPCSSHTSSSACRCAAPSVSRLIQTRLWQRCSTRGTRKTTRLVGPDAGPYQHSLCLSFFLSISLGFALSRPAQSSTKL